MAKRQCFVLLLQVHRQRKRQREWLRQLRCPLHEQQYVVGSCLPTGALLQIQFHMRTSMISKALISMRMQGITRSATWTMTGTTITFVTLKGRTAAMFRIRTSIKLRRMHGVQARAGAGGNIKLQDGSAGGSYKQTDVDLPGDAAINRAGAQMIATDGLGSINFLLTNMSLQVGTAGLGVGVEAGFTALRAGGAEAINTGTNAVYQSVNAAGKVQYVGRTGNFWHEQVSMRDGSQFNVYLVFQTCRLRMQRLWNRC